MDDEYELVSKSLMTNLKDENKRLKAELEMLKNSKQDVIEKKEDLNKDLINDIILQISSEAKKEKEEIVNTLNEIKELNKKTLDNTLSRTETIDIKLEGMIDTLKSLVTTLSTIVDELPKDKQEDVNNLLVQLKDIDPQNQQFATMNQKLDDIELFMTNLRILLSYIKPSDMKIEKN